MFGKGIQYQFAKILNGVPCKCFSALRPHMPSCLTIDQATQAGCKVDCPLHIHGDAHLVTFYAMTDFSGVRSWIFTNCWVMVLPPSFKPRWVTSTHRARAVDPASIAPWW